jgi:hypothetical protein
MFSQFVGASSMLLASSIASAVNMAPGAFVSPLPGTTSVLEPQLVGTVVEDVTRTLTGTFTTTNEPFEVQVQDRVILADDGTYDFYYRLTLVEKPDVYPLVVSRRGFTGYTTNVGWRSDGIGTLNPSSGSRTADGNTVLWDFGFNTPEGSVTHSIFVDTQATQYALNAEGVVDLSPSFNVNGRETFVTFGPAVPEPVSLSSLALGMLALRRVGRR